MEDGRTFVGDPFGLAFFFFYTGPWLQLGEMLALYQSVADPPCPKKTHVSKDWSIQIAHWS